MCIPPRENHRAFLSTHLAYLCPFADGERVSRRNIQTRRINPEPAWKAQGSVRDLSHHRRLEGDSQQDPFQSRANRIPSARPHGAVGCRDCHASLDFADVPNKCQDCHADLHRRKNGAECELCHNTNGWQVSVHSINEHQDRFPLIGAHAVVDCYACHKVGTVGQFNRFGLSTECISCHSKDYDTASSPNHRAMGYSTECRECHLSMDNWNGAVFNPGKLPK